MADPKDTKKKIDDRFLYDDSLDFVAEGGGFDFAGAWKAFGQWLDMLFSSGMDQDIKKVVLFGSKETEHESPLDGAAPGSRVFVERLNQFGNIPKEESPIFSSSDSKNASYSSAAAGLASANKMVLNLIGKYESKGDYNAIWPASSVKGLTNMTIKEVMNYQQDYLKNHKSSAIGKYQFVSGTLKEIYSKAGLSEGDKFTPENQDKLALYMLNKQCNLDDYLTGKISKEEILNNIANKWAAIPNTSGKGTHDGVLNNKAQISKNAALKILESAKDAYQRGMQSYTKQADSLDITQKGTKTSPFAKQRSGHKHMGEDRAVAENTPLKSPGFGRIEYIDKKGAGDAGKYVVINHGNGVYTTHMHLNKITVREGEYVEKGDQFGLSGSTGHSSGAHTHTETAILARTKSGAQKIIYVDPAKVREAGDSINTEAKQLELLKDAKSKVGTYKNVLWFGRVKDKIGTPLTPDRRRASINTADIESGLEKNKLNIEFKNAGEKTEALADNTQNMSNKDLFKINKTNFAPLPGGASPSAPNADHTLKSTVT